MPYASAVSILTELLALFEAEGVTGAFVFTFVSPSYPSSPDPHYDLDTASYSLVRTWAATAAVTATAATISSVTPAVTSRPESPQPQLPWEAKEAFYAVARAYRQLG